MLNVEQSLFYFSSKLCCSSLLFCNLLDPILIPSGYHGALLYYLASLTTIDRQIGEVTGTFNKSLQGLLRHQIFAYTDPAFQNLTAP